MQRLKKVEVFMFLLKFLLSVYKYILSLPCRVGLGSCGKNVSFGAGIELGNRKRLHLGNKVIIRKDAIIHCGKKVESTVKLGDNVLIGPFCQLRTGDGFIHIGSDSSINFTSCILGGGGVTIGKMVRIAPLCTIVAAEHVFDDVNTPIYKQGLSQKGIVIEDNVWIGTQVTILDGVKIGEGSVIGAGSVVTKSIPAFSVAVGVPAKVVKSRIDDNK